MRHNSDYRNNFIEDKKAESENQRNFEHKSDSYYDYQDYFSNSNNYNSKSNIKEKNVNNYTDNYQDYYHEEKNVDKQKSPYRRPTPTNYKNLTKKSQHFSQHAKESNDESKNNNYWNYRNNRNQFSSGHQFEPNLYEDSLDPDVNNDIKYDAFDSFHVSHDDKTDNAQFLTGVQIGFHQNDPHAFNNPPEKHNTYDGIENENDEVLEDVQNSHPNIYQSSQSSQRKYGNDQRRKNYPNYNLNSHPVRDQVSSIIMN